NVCPDGHVAVHDPRGSISENRSARRSRHRQRQQKNRLRSRRKRSWQQTRRGKKARSENHRRNRIQQNVIKVPVRLAPKAHFPTQTADLTASRDSTMGAPPAARPNMNPPESET